MNTTGIFWGADEQGEDLFKLSNYEFFAEIVDKKYLENLFNGSNYDEVDKNIRTFKMFEEIYQTSTTSLFTHYRGYFNEILNKFILEAHQHGILVYLKRRAYRFGDINDQVESEPKVLSMFMLSAGFYVWLATVALACIVFIGELIIFYSKGQTTKIRRQGSWKRKRFKKSKHRE